MKKIKFYLLNVIILLSTLWCSSVHAQGIDLGEFMIVNRTNSYPVMIKVSPVGAIYNRDREYSFERRGNALPFPFNTNNYIIGIQDTLETVSLQDLVRAQFDGQGGTSGCKFLIGYGLYMCCTPNLGQVS